jgi:RHS repeat-associated protein
MSQHEGTVTYTYDVNGFQATVMDWRGGVVSIDNDPDGRIQSVTRSNAVTTSHGFDTAGRLTSIAHTGPAGTIDSFNYTLDGNGNRTAVTSTAGTESYTLDELNRLTDVAYPDARSEAIAYDPASNRTSHTRVDGTTVGYTVDAVGQIMSDTDGTTYTYDNVGNLTSTSLGDAYGYDDHGRMVTATADGVSQTYVYDAADVRTVVDGQPQVWDRTSGLPTLISDGTDTFLHTVAGVTRTGADWHVADALGSVRNTTDNNGTVVGSQTFTAFGEQLTGTGVFGFAGQQSDPTGLQHLRARQYNPALGRFTAMDPVQPGAPGTPGWNLYGYAGSNPTTLTDPSGAFVSDYAISTAPSRAAAPTLAVLGKTVATSLVLGYVAFECLDEAVDAVTAFEVNTVPGICGLLDSGKDDSQQGQEEGGSGPNPPPPLPPLDLCVVMYPVNVREALADIDLEYSRSLALPRQTVGRLTSCVRTTGLPVFQVAAQFPLDPVRQVVRPPNIAVPGPNGPHAETKLLAAVPPSNEKLSLGVSNNFCDTCRDKVVPNSGAVILDPVGLDRGSKRAIWLPGTG